ncbi:GPI mannosyltransferase 1 [Lepraria neglecta]|uniref:GPI mannosyltransferase 1 n=1 Tax=Lepraria neglecta TaxID=209136 RepID=A0AAE0DPI3_9LECA|nr:GPI mannosyltransferase 1 [Lepraria neglecta]
MPSSFFNPTYVFTSAIILRVVLLLYGLLQDKYSPLPYTDIDYFVFTDAARYVSHGYSPYNRETYRYTPLLAWLLVPTAWPGPTWFSFGKVLFALADIVAGWLIVLMLKSPAGGNMRIERALKFASIWLLNPMVATISTRGSSEGLLGVMVVALLWAVLSRRITMAGVLLGLAVHFKIYPFIYGISIVWYLEPSPDDSKRETVSSAKDSSPTSFLQQLKAFITPNRLTLLMSSLTTFSALNIIMYAIYSTPFLTHTFLHHLKRIDHRHNFSPYNTLLHLSSASPRETGLQFESLAFLPQLALSAIFIPLALAKKDLAGTMLAQTFAFVAFNKVCTSQYFLWYTILLPFYLPYSSLLSSPRLGMTAAALWVGTQALWLQQGYELEFLGLSKFIPGLFTAGLAFFAVNCWILGIIVVDIGNKSIGKPATSHNTGGRALKEKNVVR